MFFIDRSVKPRSYSTASVLCCGCVADLFYANLFILTQRKLMNAVSQCSIRCRDGNSGTTTHRNALDNGTFFARKAFRV